MKNLHPARKRLLIGCLLLLATFFYAFAGTCGLVGELLARVSGKLLGQTGSTLLSVGMLVTGILLVVPHDAFGRFFRWALHGREARVAAVVRESDEWVRAAEMRRIVADAIQMHEGMKAAQVRGEIETPVVLPAARRRLDDVRSALRGLGYKKDEYESIVKGMDPGTSFELLVKDALKELRRESN